MATPAEGQLAIENSAGNFRSLEEKIYRTIELLKEARAQKAAAELALGTMRESFDAQTAECESLRLQLAELQQGLPEDVEIEVAYDRTALIERSIATLTHTLIEESIIVALVCVVFLFHFRSALVAILSIPLSILLAFVVMNQQGLGTNIMSLGGIAISIGVLVDAAIIMVENAHKHYEEWKGQRSHFEIILRSAQEVGPTLFFTLLVITVSFMPVFTLQSQEGRLFRPLAFTKTYAMAASALLKATPNPTDQQIDTAMSGNVCRCGTYIRIKAAIKSAASAGRKG